MRRSLRSCLMAALLCLGLEALPASLNEVEAYYKTGVGKVESELDATRKELRKGYLAALLRGQSQAQKSANLDAVIAFREEIVRVQDAKILATRDRSTVAEVAQLQERLAEMEAKARQEHARNVVGFTEKFQTILDQQVRNLTREGKTAEALRWRARGEAVATEEPYRSARLYLDGERTTPGAEVELGPAGDARGREEELAGAAERDREEDREEDRLTSGSGSWAYGGSKRSDADRGSPTRMASIQRTVVDDFSPHPQAYLPSVAPRVREAKRQNASIPTMDGSGLGTVAGTLYLIEDSVTLSKSRSYGYRSKKQDHEFVARLKLDVMPGQVLGPSLVVFDLFTRGTGSKRTVIRSDQILLPGMDGGESVVVDAGAYSYETLKARDSFSSGYRRDYSEKDEFYGFVVSVFDSEGELFFQRSSEKALDEVARTKPPSN